MENNRNYNKELRNRKAKEGWVYFSCQVPKPIKKKLYRLYKELIIIYRLQNIRRNKNGKN